MNNFIPITKQIDLAVFPGSNIDDCNKEAQELADKLNISIWFEFNDKRFIVYPKRWKK